MYDNFTQLRQELENATVRSLFPPFVESRRQFLRQCQDSGYLRQSIASLCTGGFKMTRDDVCRDLDPDLLETAPSVYTEIVEEVFPTMAGLGHVGTLYFKGERLSVPGACGLLLLVKDHALGRSPRHVRLAFFAALHFVDWVSQGSGESRSPHLASLLSAMTLAQIQAGDDECALLHAIMLRKPLCSSNVRTNDSLHLLSDFIQLAISPQLLGGNPYEGHDVSDEEWDVLVRRSDCS